MKLRCTSFLADLWALLGRPCPTGPGTELMQVCARSQARGGAVPARVHVTCVAALEEDGPLPLLCVQLSLLVTESSYR